MKKVDRNLLYKVIAGVSFFVLCLTQLLHIRTMYNLESRNYNLAEKKLIQNEYEKSISNDKLFPGGATIIDSFIYRNIDTLEKLAESRPELYNNYSKKIYDSLFLALHNANNLDSLLSAITKKHNITSDLEYSLMIESIDIAFRVNEYLPFYSESAGHAVSSVESVPPYGARIAGNLKELSADNKTSGLIVSTPMDHSYRIKFALYSDSPDRLQHVIMGMLPTILVSAFSILAVVLIFLFTFINWEKQKKISETKSDFINTITHEFQTPLSAIVIANKTIENENKILSSEKLHFLTGVIKRQTERLDILTKQVAGASTDGEIVLTTATYKLNDLVQEILSDYTINLQGKKVTVRFAIRAHADEVVLDKTYFISLFTNVLDNGIKYNHKHKKELEITTTNPSDKIIALSILDNGDGMSAKVRKHIFTRFYRDPSLTKSNEPGLGLGLYFAKKSMDAHNWKCDVKSEEGIGTHFTIFIPVLPCSSRLLTFDGKHNAMSST